jgi:hypothetical protein
LRAKPAGSRPPTTATSRRAPDALLVGRGAKIGGYPADFHVRNFLDCVKTRAQTRANADVACWSHIVCHAANIALFLNRKVTFDPQKCEFIGRRRSEPPPLRGAA